LYQQSVYQANGIKSVKIGSKKVESGENGLIIVFDN